MDEYTRHQTHMEELASHGYIVFSINHTYESMSTVFPDGRIILADARVFDASFRQEYGRLNLDDQLSVWVADAIFVLDQLEELNAGNVSNSFTGRLDMKRVGVFGMSFGGAMSAEVCLKDSRCEAGANMDGSQFGYVDFSAQHLKTPFLFFYNERSEGMNDYIYTGVENWAYRVTIQGTTHASFTDTILWSPSMEYSSKFIPQQFGPIDSQRMIEIQRAYLLAFFDRHLKGENTPFLDGPPGVFPEVDFQFRKQSD
jgi:predicted dienelactone hydrolase